MIVRVCSLNLTLADVAAWHDQTLSPSDMRRISDHVATCLMCQQRSAQFQHMDRSLAGQTAPDLAAQIWSGLAPRLAAPRPTALSHGIFRVGIGLATAGVAVLIILAIVVVVLPHGGATDISQVPPPALQTAIAATETTYRATAAAQATVVVQPASASFAFTAVWGAIPLTQLHDTLPDATAFTPFDTFPDGRALVGLAIDRQHTTTVVVVDLPSLHVRRLATANATPGVVRTDGRYVVWLNSDAQSTTIHAVDLQTGADQTFSEPTGIPFGAFSFAVDHGYAVWENGAHALIAANVATGATTTVTDQLAPPEAFVMQESWPNVLYETAAHTIVLANLSTGQQITQPITPPGAVFKEWSATLVGATVFWTHPATSGTATVIEEIDHADRAGAISHPITMVNASPFLMQANDRLLVWETSHGTVAWDRLLHRTVPLTTTVTSPALLLRGTALVLVTSTEGTVLHPLTFSLIATDSLPTVAVTP